jgi:hypothetical protein
MDRRQAEMFRDLSRGNFVALGPALSRRPLPIAIGAVETSARSVSPKLTPLPEAVEDVQSLILTPSPEEMRQPVRRHRPPPPAPTADIMAQLARSKPEPEASPEPVFAIIDEAEREDTLAAIVSEMVDDPDAAFRTDAVLFQDFLVRCRIRRLQGEPVGLPEFRRRLAVAKARIDRELAAGEPWQQALALSAGLPDDLQSVFLIVAKAAISGEPCPPDTALARAYGTHSARRARRLLTYFEEQGVAVVRTDFHGRRVVAFPDLGCETAPGDPDADDAPLAEAAE